MDNRIVLFQLIDDKLRFAKKKAFKGHNVAGYACSIDFAPDMRYTYVENYFKIIVEFGLTFLKRSLVELFFLFSSLNLNIYIRIAAKASGFRVGSVNKVFLMLTSIWDKNRILGSRIMPARINRIDMWVTGTRLVAVEPGQSGIERAIGILHGEDKIIRNWWNATIIDDIAKGIIVYINCSLSWRWIGLRYTLYSRSRMFSKMRK